MSKVVALELDLHLILLGTSLHLQNIHCVSGLQVVLLCSQLLGLDILFLRCRDASFAEEFFLSAAGWVHLIKREHRR